MSLIIYNYRQINISQILLLLNYTYISIIGIYYQ